MLSEKRESEPVASHYPGKLRRKPTPPQGARRVQDARYGDQAFSFMTPLDLTLPSRACPHWSYKNTTPALQCGSLHPPKIAAHLPLRTLSSAPHLRHNDTIEFSHTSNASMRALDASHSRIDNNHSPCAKTSGSCCTRRTACSFLRGAQRSQSNIVRIGSWPRLAGRQVYRPPQ
jgi:hypothetical protein